MWFLKKKTNKTLHQNKQANKIPPPKQTNQPTATKNKGGILTCGLPVWFPSIQSPRGSCSFLIPPRRSPPELLDRELCLSSWAEPWQCSCHFAALLLLSCLCKGTVSVLQSLVCCRTFCDLEKLYFVSHFCSWGQSVSLLLVEIFFALFASVLFLKLSNVISPPFWFFWLGGSNVAP